MERVGNLLSRCWSDVPMLGMFQMLPDKRNPNNPSDLGPIGLEYMSEKKIFDIAKFYNVTQILDKNAKATESPIEPEYKVMDYEEQEDEGYNDLSFEDVLPLNRTIKGSSKVIHEYIIGILKLTPKLHMRYTSHPLAAVPGPPKTRPIRPV